jgi:F-type H+-transporting ATPase subunit delta
MGSATREALEAARAVLAGVSRADVATGEQLLAAGRVIGDSAPLLAALVDTTVENADRASIVNAVFGGYTATAQKLLVEIATQRWSRGSDLLAGIEEIGIRVLGRSAPASVSLESELFGFEAAVQSDSQLELAVSSKLGGPEAKAALVGTLLKGASRQTQAIVEHLVQQPRGRRIGELLRLATTLVASEQNRLVATITTAAPLPATQTKRLTQALSAKYGTEVLVQQVVDPAVIGGVRIAVGDDVIDGTVQSRLTDLRLQLAG